ncbi:UNVERIFIED_CONTAM: hypothetical protein FKN15_074950 [Acipenser sinensis]
MPGTQDTSSLHSLIEKPPICGNTFNSLTGTLLTGFRLHAGPCWSELLLYLSAVLLGESVLLLLTHRSTAVRLDRMERGLLVSLVILVCSPSRGVSQTIITQDPGSVTGTEEGEVTVPCTVTGAPPGSVRWYRDTGSGRQYLYSTSPPPPNESNDPRVSIVHQNHATDLSIRIVNLNLRDSGMYYCEKYGGIDVTLIASGSGSRLSVRALPPLIITQDPDPLTGTKEGEVTLPCTLSTVGPPGPVRWYRDTGSGRQYLYSPSPPPPNERNDPRVSRVHPDHPTDLSIRIVNLTLRDSGRYYCEKYRGSDETLIASGSGSRLSVRAFTRLYEAELVLQGDEDAKTFVHSCVFTYKQHHAFCVSLPDISTDVNRYQESIFLTCRARGFYPERVDVSWVEQGGAVEPAAERGENAENEDGTFSRNSVLNVTVTQELSGATCWSELLLYLSAVLLGESVLLFLTHRSTAVRLDRMERGLLVSLVILVCSPSRGVSQTIITQDPGSVTGTEEGEVTVPCTVTGSPPGPVRWYRDTGSGRQYLYSTAPPPPNERNDPRVSQVHQHDATDHSIRIVRLTLRDSGMYYCEKYRGIDVTLIASGSGSRLSVRALPPLIITQDPGSVTGTEEGEVTLPCTLSRVAPAGPVRWYRDTGRGRQYLYSTIPPPPSERNDPRASRVYPDHLTDLSIRIVRLTVNDSGMYYCEKYRGFDGSLIARGSGSRLSVRALPPLIITQDPDSVTGTEEGEVTLPCTLSRVGAAGPVRWYRGTGSGREYLYSTGTPPPNERNDPRVSRVYQDHPTDLSIRIVKMTLSDSGTYYCVKYGGIDETLIASGSGSRLSVREPPCSSNLFLVSVFLLVKLALLAAINAFLFVLLKLEQRRLGYQHLPTSTKGYQDLPTSTKGYQDLPRSIKGYQGPQTSSLETLSSGWFHRPLSVLVSIGKVCETSHVL